MYITAAIICIIRTYKMPCSVAEIYRLSAIILRIKHHFSHCATLKKETVLPKHGQISTSSRDVTSPKITLYLITSVKTATVTVTKVSANILRAGTQENRRVVQYRMVL
jgi:hypothetical protein